MKMVARLHRAGSIIMYTLYVTITVLGGIGMFNDPSPTVVAMIGGRLASTIWSLMFVIFGLMALCCRLANKLKWLDTTRSEAIAIIFIGLAMGLFSWVIVWSIYDERGPNSPGSWQTALGLGSGALIMIGVPLISLAETRRKLIMTKAESERVMLQSVADEVRRSTKEL